MIKAKIIADSVDSRDNRLTTFVVTFPRIILAEFNTHRMFCLSGDSLLTFDLPSGQKNSDFRCYKMTLKDFYNKWTQGATKRKRHSYEVNLEPETIYTAKQISILVNKQVSNIRNKCRDNTIKVQNPSKSRSEDFLILGKDYNQYHNGYEATGQNIKSRLSSMKIRQINENTGLIQHSTIQDCIFSGIKSVYKLTLENGMFLKCSENHKVLTENGWKELKNISESDYVIVQAFGTKETSDSYKYKKVNGKWVNTFLRNIKSQIEKDQNHTCFNCDNNIDDLHHKIPIYKDLEKAFDYSNIIGLCKECHFKEHKKQDWQVSQYLYGKPVKVKQISYTGEEETFDLEISGEFPNFLANDIVVHNSRNSASSRAIPFEKMVRSVKENPFIPIAVQRDHKGMQGTEYLDETQYEVFKMEWLAARDSAINHAEYLNKESFTTKQLCNRLLEPFMWHTVIVSATDFENFFALRCSRYDLTHFQMMEETQLFKSKKQAIKAVKENECTDIDLFEKADDLWWLNCNKGQSEIHMMALAECMWDAYNESKPKELKEGEWHIPFGNNINEAQIFMRQKAGDWTIDYKPMPFVHGDEKKIDDWYQEQKVKIATARCARVSYTVVGEDKESSYEADIKLHDRLLESKHLSPFEHCAKVMSDEEYKQFGKSYPNENNIRGCGYIADYCNEDIYLSFQQGWCDNFKGFIQYRSLID